MLAMECSVGHRLLQILNPSRNPSGEGVFFPSYWMLVALDSLGQMKGSNKRK